MTAATSGYPPQHPQRWVEVDKSFKEARSFTPAPSPVWNTRDMSGKAVDIAARVDGTASQLITSINQAEYIDELVMVTAKSKTPCEQVEVPQFILHPHLM